MRGGVDEAGFSELFRATSADVLAFLLRRCPSPEDAADCLAETYMVAWEKRQRMPGGGEARPWLFGVARNVVRRGSERRYRATETAYALAGELLASGAVTPPPAVGETDPVIEALAQLAELDREIITMIAWDGLAPREIALALGISSNAVRVRAHRARAHLRALIGARARASLRPRTPAPLAPSGASRRASARCRRL